MPKRKVPVKVPVLDPKVQAMLKFGYPSLTVWGTQAYDPFMYVRVSWTTPLVAGSLKVLAGDGLQEKNPLPTPLAVGIRIHALDGMEERHAARSRGKIPFVQGFDFVEVLEVDIHHEEARSRERVGVE
jgi:hypothetical protein